MMMMTIMMMILAMRVEMGIGTDAGDDNDNALSALG
jgi:hypothetical protein